MASEVAVRVIGSSGDPAAADLLAPEVTMAVAGEPSGEVAGASQGVVLVLSSLPQPASPSAPLGTSSQRLDDDVLL